MSTVPEEPDVIGVLGAIPPPQLSDALEAIADHIAMDSTEEAAQEAAVLRQAADALSLLAQREEEITNLQAEAFDWRMRAEQAKERIGGLEETLKHDAALADQGLEEAERILKIISEIETVKGISYIVEAGEVMKRIALNYFQNPKHFDTAKCGFDRDGSYNAGHYVCMCGWEDKPAEAADRGRERK